MGARGSSVSTADDGNGRDIDDNSDADGKIATRERYPSTPKTCACSPVSLAADNGSDDDITWAPSLKHTKNTLKATNFASQVEETPSDRKRRDVKFESLQDTC